VGLNGFFFASGGWLFFQKKNKNNNKYLIDFYLFSFLYLLDLQFTIIIKMKKKATEKRK